MTPLRATLLLLVLTLAPTMSPASNPGASAEATALVEKTLDEVLTVLRDTSLADAERRTRVEAIVYARFDFDTISRLVLARNWKKLTPQQRDEFVVELKQHLSLSYWKTLDDNRDSDAQVRGAQEARNGDVTVRSEVEAERTQPVRIDYRLRRGDAGWHVIDVIIEGVSLVQNFRTQTQELIQDAGVDHLIQKLREKNEARGDG